MKQSFNRQRNMIALVLGGGLLPCIISANPSGAKVAHGKAEFSHPSNHDLHIKTEKNTIINWDKFSIDAGEITKFIQPGKHSAVLNRVTGQDPSHIRGTLQSNGKVYLVNPQGVVIGKEGVIHTAGFLASALDLSDSDFLKQDAMHFQGSTRNGITNQGSIKTETGDVILIGYRVDNQGTIEAPDGQVAIGAGLNILIRPKDTQKLFIQPELSAEQEGIGIDSQGSISALEVELQASGNLYSKAVRHSGTIDASKVVEKGGRIFIVAEKGNTEVAGVVKAPKGEVQILGETVSVKNESLIDTSGEDGGGNIFIGGGFQGKDPDLICSKETMVEKGAVLLADAKVSGNGGEVVVWSDGATHFYGSVSAQGGPEGGNGGLVEVSGKKFLGYHGQVSTLAQNGKTGTLLLDPSDITFPTGADANISQSTSGGTTTFTPTNSSLSTSTISAASFETAITANNVVIQTGSTETSSPGNITLNTYSYASSHSLTLNAHGDILANTADLFFDNSGTGDIILTAGNNILFELTNSGLSMSVIQTGGNITATAAKRISIIDSSASPKTIPVLNTTGSSGNISLTTSQNNIEITDAYLRSGKDLSLIAGSSVQANNAKISAPAGQLMIVSDNSSSSCASGNGFINIQNSILTSHSTKPILLFASSPSAVNLTNTTLNGVSFSSDHNVFNTCYGKQSETTLKGYSQQSPFTAYYKSAGATTTTTTITAPTTAITAAPVAATNESTKAKGNFAFASPRTLWILFLALVGKIRRTFSRVLTFIRRVACV